MGMNLRFSPLEWNEKTKVLEMGNAAIAQKQSGVYERGLYQTGTFSANAIELAGAYSGHMIYVNPSATLATNKRVFRLADYGNEFPVVGGQGVIRTYCKVTSGTGDTALQFHWGYTSCTANLIGSQMQMESWANSPGPTGVHVHDFIAGIADGKYLAASVGVGDGLVCTWHKVYAAVGSVCNGNVFPIWIDHQMSCAVGGTEAGIKTSTGGTVPDAFVWFNTTSGGWASVFFFDSTMVGKPPLSALAPQNTTQTSDGSFIINLNGTLYYVPYFAAAKCA